MSGLVLRGLDEVRTSAGTALGPTEWVEITQERLEAWERACPGAPHGWLLLSLTNLFMPEMVTVEDVSAGLNVGTGSVRFADEAATLAPGTRVRGTGRIEGADEVKPGAVQTTIHLTVESDAGTPLVEVASLSRWLA